MYVESEGGSIMTSPPVDGYVTVVGRSGAHAVWRHRKPGGSVLYLVKTHEFEAEVVRVAPLSELDDMLLTMKLVDGRFDPQTAALVLSGLWLSGHRDRVTAATSQHFTSAIISLVTRSIPLDVAIEVAIAIGLEEERCQL